MRVLKDTLHGATVCRLVHVDLGICSMKGHDHRELAFLQQWEKVDADVAEVDVEQAGVDGAQPFQDPASFTAVNGNGAAEELFLPDPPQRMGAGFGEDVHVREGKGVGVLPLLGEHDRAEAAQRGDLPIDVEHLRLEKGDDVGADDRCGHGRCGERDGAGGLCGAGGEPDFSSGWGGERKLSTFLVNVAPSVLESVVAGGAGEWNSRIERGDGAAVASAFL